jgi:uncharacterized protein
MSSSQSRRLEGLDLARFLALVGMVIVNFKIAMGVPEESAGWAAALGGGLEGRAAATFVVLAGIGLGLACHRASGQPLVAVTLRRSAFLMAIGLLNSLIFEADILHYYAVYFALGVFCLPLSRRWLAALIATMIFGFLVLVFVLDYEAGWNWQTLTYSGFWTPEGFVRNLLFNGWHPVVPWLAFLLFGIVLAKSDLARPRTQHVLIGGGIAVWLAAEALSWVLQPRITGEWLELADLVGTGPVPPAPLYMLAGGGFAAAMVGLCLVLAAPLKTIGVLDAVTPAGRQTLTLYIAHIFLGMGTLEALGMLGGQSAEAAFAAALLFCLAATLFAWVWARRWKRGPMEMLMRRLAG